MLKFDLALRNPNSFFGGTWIILGIWEEVVGVFDK
jgi:hypothetical protein